MKKISAFILLLAFVSATGMVCGQEKKSKKQRQQEHAEQVQKMIESQDYKFIAQRALPMSGRSVNLTFGYDVNISKDTISSHLPYFGRAYVAPMNNTQAGIRFVSTDFEYQLENAKKDGWNVNITPKDGQRRCRFTLRVFSNGSASLTVNDDTRQSISFNGYITERQKK